MTELPRRSVLCVGGTDRVEFLQGLVSNDVRDAGPDRAVWAALLTPQGKYLADFFIVGLADRLLLDCAADQAALVAARLTRFRLRAQVQVGAEPVLCRVYAGWDGAAMPDAAGAVVVADPRLPAAGWRMLAPDGLAVATDAAFADWDRHRIGLGLPDAGRDLEAEKTVLLEAGFDELHGVSWSKGCYMGQELTARTKYRGLIKRRLVPVRAAGPVPEPGSAILAGTREVGTLHDGCGDMALATLRLDAMDEALSCAGVALAVVRPEWMAAAA